MGRVGVDMVQPSAAHTPRDLPWVCRVSWARWEDPHLIWAFGYRVTQKQGVPSYL